MAIVLAICLLPLGVLADDTRGSGAVPKKTVVPFDFVSKFDNGRYGQTIGELVWKRLERDRGFLIPGSMQEVRDLCSANSIRILPSTPLDKVKTVLSKQFDAQVAIWGSVERAAGAEGEIYDVTLKCVDFSGPEPKIIYDKTARTKSVSEIPHLYVKEMLDKLYGRQPAAPPAPDAAAEDRWKNGPNLVVGDFEQAVGGVPRGWDSRAGQKREPLGGLVRRAPEDRNPANHVIRFTFPAIVGDNEGVMYYSDEFPVHEGAKYRFQCRWRTTGPTAKVFIKCYQDTDSEYRPEPSASGKPGDSLNAPSGQRREVYRSQQNLKGPPNTWNVHTEDFTPRHAKYSPKWGRVMLYAYLGAGSVEFDDVVVKEIVPAASEN